MFEIETLEQARHLYKCFFVPLEDLGKRADQIVEGMISEIESKKVTIGNTCSHFGGDYWFHFRQKSDSLMYFCNIPPGPTGFYLSSLTREKYYEAVLKFLKDRNVYIERAIAYFEDERTTSPFRNALLCRNFDSCRGH